MPKKLTYEYVKSFIEKEGYVLLSHVYINSKTKLSIQCPKEHIFEMRFDDFKHNHRCVICGNINKSDKLKTHYDKVKNYIVMSGYELISPNYKNNKEKIELKCSNGHTFQMAFDNFKNGGQRCPICSYINRYDNVKNNLSYVKNKMNVDGYTLISNSYENNHIKMTLKCPNNHVFKSSFNNFTNKNSRCPICSYKERKSNPEKEIFEYIKSIYYGKIIENDRTIAKNYWTNKYLELDLYLPEDRKAIEFNGIYWHSKTYKKWLDEMKKKQCKQKNIDLLVIKEENWITNKEYVLQIMHNFINNIKSIEVFIYGIS